MSDTGALAETLLQTSKEQRAVGPESSTTLKRDLLPRWDSETSAEGQLAKKKCKGGKLSKKWMEELMSKKDELLSFLEEKGREWDFSSGFLLCSMNLDKTLQAPKASLAWNKFQHDYALQCEKGGYSAVMAAEKYNELWDQYGGGGLDAWKDYLKETQTVFELEKQEAAKSEVLVENNQGVVMGQLQKDLMETIKFA